jgi:predicted transposase/invertase (TIGR01784 family)
MARYLDPKNDLTFKRIFGEHPDLLINFLNSVMPFEPGRQIEEIEYLPSELPPQSKDRKYSIVDVRCKDNYKRQFIIEMQMVWSYAFYNRIVFNAGKAYVRQLKKAEAYDALKPVYTLVLLDENFDDKTSQFYHHYQIVNRENTDEIIPGLEFVLVELTDKFRPETINDRKLMVLWLRFLKEVDESIRELPSEMQENEFINQAAELCEIGAFTQEELDQYDKYWDMIRTEKTLMGSARREALAKGRAEGLAEGRAEGIKKGRAEGKAEGEAQKNEQVAINAFKRGISIPDIADITNLLPEQIHEILKQKGLIH